MLRCLAPIPRLLRRSIKKFYVLLFPSGLCFLPVWFFLTWRHSPVNATLPDDRNMHLCMLIRTRFTPTERERQPCCCCYNYGYVYLPCSWSDLQHWKSDASTWTWAKLTPTGDAVFLVPAFAASLFTSWLRPNVSAALSSVPAWGWLSSFVLFPLVPELQAQRGTGCIQWGPLGSPLRRQGLGKPEKEAAFV